MFSLIGTITWLSFKCDVLDQRWAAPALPRSSSAPAPLILEPLRSGSAPDKKFCAPAPLWLQLRPVKILSPRFHSGQDKRVDSSFVENNTFCRYELQRVSKSVRVRAQLIFEETGPNRIKVSLIIRKNQQLFHRKAYIQNTDK